MVIELKIAGEEDSGKWDNIVQSSSHGTLFHTWKCLKIMEKYSKTKLYPLIVINGTELNGSEPIGCIPLFLQKKLSMKLLFCPPPHVAISRLGPVLYKFDELKQSKREDYLVDFLKKVDEFIFSQIKPNYLTLSSAHIQDSRSYIWKGYNIIPTFNYDFSLEKGLDQIWSNIKKNTRQDINRAEKRGLSVREGNKEDMLRIYELQVERYAQQNRNVKEPFEYLSEMYDTFYPSNLKIYVVEFEGNVITGNINVIFNDRVITWIGNSKTIEHANDLLTWECIKRSYNSGFKHYELMGAAGHERLYHTHAKFNPDLIVSFSATKYSSFASKLVSDITFKSSFLKSWLNKI